MSKRLLILDNTLRDGEQQALINFSKKQKKELANEILKIGVDFIDIMPIANINDQGIVQELIKVPFALSTPLTQQAIKMSCDLKRDIILFQAVSNRLLAQRYGLAIEKAKQENISRFVRSLKEIRKCSGNIKIFVAGEDSSRAEIGYLIKFIKAIEKYIDGFFIADSVGYLIPEKTEEIVKKIKKECHCLIGIHAHNDLGFADENTLRAVLAGADIISGTFTGIGERAGNANLGKVLRELKKRKLLPHKINNPQIKKVEKLVRKYAKTDPAAPLSKEAFFVETGIHINALLDGPTGYSLIDPVMLGFEHKVFFGKKSGISNFKWYFGKKYSDKKYAEFRDKIKEYSLKKNKSFTLTETKHILRII